MTIREFAKLNNFPIRGKLTRIPDEVEYAWGFSTKEKSRIAAMIEKERMEARQRRGSYEW